MSNKSLLSNLQRRRRQAAQRDVDLRVISAGETTQLVKRINPAVGTIDDVQQNLFHPKLGWPTANQVGMSYGGRRGLTLGVRAAKDQTAWGCTQPHTVTCCLPATIYHDCTILDCCIARSLAQGRVQTAPSASVPAECKAAMGLYVTGQPLWSAYARPGFTINGNRHNPGAQQHTAPWQHLALTMQHTRHACGSPQLCPERTPTPATLIRCSR